MACVDRCPAGAISVDTNIKAYNAFIDASRCTNCGLCFGVCQENHPPQLHKPIHWRQGWANRINVHNCGASGGLATAVMLSFVENGGCVCSCVFRDGKFCFSLVSHPEDIKAFAGSKYVKSNPTGAYLKMRKALVEGKKVLFVGLPCQISSARNFMGESLSENFFAIDLICHGTPSPEILNKFFLQYRSSLSSFSSVSFRQKKNFKEREEARITFASPGTMDGFSIAFLEGAIYTENCYNCRYATNARVGDLTLGDSWGSVLPGNLREKGISLAICQNQKGIQLLEQSDIWVEAVDVEKAILSNGQLRHPPTLPEQRIKIMRALETDKPFNAAIKHSFPKQYVKQRFKALLIRLGLKKRNEIIVQINAVPKP